MGAQRCEGASQELPTTAAHPAGAGGPLQTKHALVTSHTKWRYQDTAAVDAAARDQEVAM